MFFLQIILLLFLIIGPVALAWFKGDAILSHVAKRRQQRQRQRRRRTTQSLPVRDVALKALLAAEARRDGIEDRMGEALTAFRQVTENGRELTLQSSISATLDDLEQAVLARESIFGDYIDIAWLQSETIEVLHRQVDLLQAVSRDTPTDASHSQASAHLMHVLADATQRRVQIDRALNRIGSAGISASEHSAPKGRHDLASVD